MGGGIERWDFKLGFGEVNWKEDVIGRKYWDSPSQNEFTCFLRHGLVV